jgi:hypothetical protein
MNLSYPKLGSYQPTNEQPRISEMPRNLFRAIKMAREGNNQRGMLPPKFSCPHSFAINACRGCPWLNQAQALYLNEVSHYWQERQVTCWHGMSSGYINTGAAPPVLVYSAIKFQPSLIWHVVADG